MARMTKIRMRRVRARERQRLSDLERRGRRDPERKEGSEYLFFALGIGLLVTAVLVIATAGVLAAGFPFVLGAAALLGLGFSKRQGRRRGLPATVSKERELLSAIRDNGGSITPAEAAMETTLTVREADRMLSELAGEGHLAVESRHGALYYALPGRSGHEIEG